MLAELAEQINRLAALAARTHVIFNNNFEDRGQRNARTLTGILGLFDEPDALVPGADAL